MIGNVWEWTHGLVVGQARSRRAEGVLHSGKSARRARGRQLRSAPAEDQNSPQGHQRRLASVRAELLPPLSPGRAPCGAGRYVDKPCRISMRCQNRERPMPSQDEGDRSSLKQGAFNRRNMLLAGTTIAAASALGSTASRRGSARTIGALGSENPTSSSSWATISAGSTSAPTIRASCIRRRRTWTRWRARACASPTITRSRAAPPAAPTSSPGNCRSAPA